MRHWTWSDKFILNGNLYDLNEKLLLEDLTTLLNEYGLDIGGCLIECDADGVPVSEKPANEPPKR